MNGRITAMKANGEIGALQDKWFGFRMDLADQIPSFS